MRNSKFSRRDVLKGTSALTIGAAGANLFAEPLRAAAPSPEAITFPSSPMPVACCLNGYRSGPGSLGGVQAPRSCMRRTFGRQTSRFHSSCFIGARSR